MTKKLSKEDIKRLKEIIAAAEAEPAKVKSSKGSITSKTTERQADVLTFIQTHGQVTLGEIHEHMGGARSNIFNYLKRLRAVGKVVRVNGSNPVRYSSDASVNENSNTKINRTYSDHAEAILEFVSKHVGERYYANDMFKTLGIPKGSGAVVVADLKKRGLLDKDFNLGSNPFVTGEPVSDALQVGEPQDLAEPNPGIPAAPIKDPLFIQIDFLAWTYIKQTRNTDLVAFLNWIEERSK